MTALLFTIVPAEEPSTKLISSLSAVTPFIMFNSSAPAVIDVPDNLSVVALTSPLAP